MRRVAPLPLLLFATLLATTTAGFFPPSVTLQRTGKRVALLGKGPPVVFSTGLFGTMPRQIYTQFVRRLLPNVTVVVLDGPDPVTADVVDDIAESLAVDRVGFLSHSSFDAAVLEEQRRVGEVCLLDPVVLPSYDWTAGWTAPQYDREVKIIRAGRAYDPEVSTPIPEYISPDVSPTSPTVVYHDAGHADLLDDTWATMGPQLLPFMKGLAPARQPFETWSRAEGDGGTLRDRRKAYRDAVARDVVEWMLRDAQPQPGETEEETEEENKKEGEQETQKEDESSPPLIASGSE